MSGPETPPPDEGPCRRWLTVGPGLLLVLLLSIAGRALHSVAPTDWSHVLGEAVMGLGLGLLVGNFVCLPCRFQPGIRLSFDVLLKTAIVLLGVRISLHQIAGIGWGVLALTVTLIAVAISLTRTLASAARISPKLGLLIGVGTSICGNTAIAVTAPVIHADDEEVSFAIATNTLFGTLAVFAYPMIGRLLGFTDTFFGVWVGTAVNDTSQVVAAGMSYGLVAGELATTVKLTRNALMAFVVVGTALWFGRMTGEPSGATRSDWWSKVKTSVPLFVVGFFVMAILNSLGVFQTLSERFGRDLVGDLTHGAKFLILMALVGVGLNTQFSKLRRLGISPLLIGFTASLTTALISYGVLRFLLDV